MFAIEADLSVGRSVWSAPSFLETLISEEPRQPNSNVLLIRRSWYQSGQMAILLVLIKSGSAADSDQPTTVKNLRRSLLSQRTSDNKWSPVTERAILPSLTPLWWSFLNSNFALSLLWSLKRTVGGNYSMRAKCKWTCGMWEGKNKVGRRNTIPISGLPV